ncbi:MAG: lytic transglycosylase domain-containing protein [Actinomycetes bacterium]
MSRARHAIVSHTRRRIAIRAALGGSAALILASPAVPANAAQARVLATPAPAAQSALAALAPTVSIPVTGAPTAIRIRTVAKAVVVAHRLAVPAAVPAAMPRLSAHARFGSVGYNQWYASSTMAAMYNWHATQFICLAEVWQHESNWNQNAHNPSSGAHGIPQALPGSKMASAGANWRTDPRVQIRWGLGYIKTQYGTPCAAWAFWQNHSWY